MPLMARWLSWLERRPVTAEVDGSNPFRVVFINENNSRQREKSLKRRFFFGCLFYCPLLPILLIF